MMKKTVLITGSSGFIGYYLVKKLLENGMNVVGIDNMNHYYDIKLKEYRLNLLSDNKNYIFINGDISKKKIVTEVFKKYNPSIVANLAAQAGIRYSSKNPDSYIKSNIIGFYNIINACKEYNVEHLIYASSSSVYGNSNNIPCEESDKTDKPISLYAATKKTDELLAHVYSQTYGLKTTGLRFFTVYGPLGRPDMAYYSFTTKLLNNEIIELYNYGLYKRDFTYIDDVINCIIKIMDTDNNKKYSIYNIGNSNPIAMNDFVKLLSDILIKEKALPNDFDIDKHVKLLPKNSDEADITYANTNELNRDFNISFNTDIKDGMEKFIKWYIKYRGNNT